jgi:hypothetical protein
MILEEVMKAGAKHLVIDSLSAMAQAFKGLRDAKTYTNNLKIRGKSFGCFKRERKRKKVHAKQKEVQRSLGRVVS